ncbi:cytochrome c oxidase assembly protein COX15 [Panicum miliaceum]|uniref:Cytochrome c oxidase assembly protein COX15 n=1 Tax=Panicum miliaceum TaxID=4540 RepID=A0A3L6RCF0_PANMI|nr:cytochrome c oxidase assembly protein COX15 [Panicum miliaceum]
MGSRVAASLLRRGRDQASTLMIPRLFPRSAPAPAVPRAGPGGGGGGCLLTPRPGSAGAFSSGSRFASFHALRSLARKTLLGQCTRKMSTTAAALNSTVANGTANQGLKLLVTKGPQAQMAVGIWLFSCAAWVFSLVNNSAHTFWAVND